MFFLSVEKRVNFILSLVTWMIRHLEGVRFDSALEIADLMDENDELDSRITANEAEIDGIKKQQERIDRVRTRLSGLVA